MAVVAHEDDAAEDLVDVVLPEPGTLARAFDASQECRNQLRALQKVLAWERPELIGAANLRSAALNVEPLIVLLEFWCCICPTAKPPPVNWLKAEAGQSYGQRLNCNRRRSCSVST